MDYPPLFPRDPTLPFSKGAPTLAPKRRAVAVACDACRRRKVRCTGEFPTCAACQRRGAECKYADIANDREMRSNQLKKRVKELEDENRSLWSLFENLRKPDGRMNEEILRGIQAGDDFGTVVENARDNQGKRKRSPSPGSLTRQRPSEWTTIRGILPRTPVASPAAVYPIVLPIHASPSSVPLPSPPIDTPTSPKDAILGLLTLPQTGKPDLVLLNEARPKEHCDLRLNELSVSYWTRVPISDRSASTLISTFLETDNSAVGFIDKDLFLTDLVQHNPTFCSAFLVSSILYLACFAHTASDGRAATLAHSFFNDAERLYRAERLSDNLTTLAAINIFSLGCFSHGNESLGQDLLLSGRQMGKRMNLYGLDPTSSELYKHDEERLEPLATISETWQRIVEKHTFQDFNLGVPDLLGFQWFVKRGQLQLVKSITLKVPARIYVNEHEYGVCDTIQRNFPDIISSTTVLESIHIEKWWNGAGICESYEGFKLPPSVKQLSYFYGVSRNYLMESTKTSREPLDLTSQAAGHLEHIALSYSITANDFLDDCKEVEFKQLKTLAPTHRFFGAPDTELLKAASEAAKRMPAL
ncbi:regulatory CAT8 [Fusarium denticulatum]|uniref:Regulatory CAT8 n=1 Tax=Fusarium denticulatum TaxID=48507 RepID=A0A8H5T2M0_9HYPO|nr:regulatory CAT8 [Fusarium denticulatum]